MKWRFPHCWKRTSPQGMERDYVLLFSRVCDSRHVTPCRVISLTWVPVDVGAPSGLVLPGWVLLVRRTITLMIRDENPHPAKRGRDGPPSHVSFIAINKLTGRATRRSPPRDRDRWATRPTHL